MLASKIMVSIKDIKKALQESGFSCIDARVNDLLFGYQEEYYAAPRKGIYRLTKQSTKGLCERVLEVFRGLVGRSYLHEREEDVMKGHYEGRDSSFWFYIGEFEKISLPDSSWHAFGVPHFSLRTANQKIPVPFYIQPSQEYIDLFLNLMDKVEEVYGRKGLEKRIFRYKSLSTGQEIIVPLVPQTEEDSLFIPLGEIGEGVLRKDGKRIVVIPTGQRGEILEQISKDISEFGGSYNWTTGYRGERIHIERYNQFFRNKAKIKSGCSNRKLYLVKP
jgi:hypothetical protein